MMQVLQTLYLLVFPPVLHLDLGPGALALLTQPRWLSLANSRAPTAQRPNGGKLFHLISAWKIMARRISILWIMLFSHVYGEAAHSLVAGGTGRSTSGGTRSNPVFGKQRNIIILECVVMYHLLTHAHTHTQILCICYTQVYRSIVSVRTCTYA